MTVSQVSLANLMLERRSIRQYDPTVTISAAELRTIINSATRAPSSQNMQPWHFVIVSSAGGKEQIKPAMLYNQTQAETASAMIFIFGDLDPAQRVEQIMQGPVDNGTMSAENRARRVEQISSYYQQAALTTLRETALLDAGLVAMNLMISARAHGYETCAIGGFDKEQIGEILGLDPQRYFPILALSIGQAAETGYDSFRLPSEDVMTWL